MQGGEERGGGQATRGGMLFDSPVAAEGRDGQQGLKPRRFMNLIGRAEAVPLLQGGYERATRFAVGRN